MNNKAFRTIIILIAISLIGLMVTQLQWMRNALNQSEDQFDHRVTMALKDVIDEVKVIVTENKNLSLDSSQCVNDHLSLYHLIHVNTLDSLLTTFFQYHFVDTNFIFSLEPCDESHVQEHVHGGVISDSLSFSKHQAIIDCKAVGDCYKLIVRFPKKRKFVLLNMSLWLIFSILFLLAVLFSFIYIVTIIIKQKKLTEIRDDFINNMTHEFKTPISTISMASEGILGIHDKSDKDRIEKYASIIFEENIRLQNLVEKVLSMAVLDQTTFDLDLAKVDLHELIKEATTTLRLEDTDNDVHLVLKLKSKNPVVMADEMHLRSVIDNLIDNAYKYSLGSPHIQISVDDTESGLKMTITDYGIGMSMETQRHIFDKFYRKPTGNLHNVKGYGIGLYYVRKIIEAHGGYIKVQSELNKGSKFFVFLNRSNKIHQ